MCKSADFLLIIFTKNLKKAIPSVIIALIFYAEVYMAVYYIDPICGLDENDGLTESTPKKDYTKIEVKSGDSLLFKCGSFFRGALKNAYNNTGDVITYSSYGKGEKPTFCGSVDTLSKAECWTEERKNIWVTERVEDEVCNFIFDGGKECGTLRWSVEEMCEQGDYYDNCFGTRNIGRSIPDGHKIYMYSEKNPAEYYTDIETVVYGSRWMAATGSNLVFDGLRFINSGVHGIAGGGAKNMIVRNCDFEYIGGCVWSTRRKIRFGNGVECWNVAENVSVTNCRFYEIYDSGVTHQGGDECKPAENMHFDNNIFIKCGMGAYEQRDLMPKYATFNNNVCLFAGEGFSKQGEEQLPRMSEVWPMPMGHHVFLWRIAKPTDDGKLEIKNNIFYGAPIGASIYSIIYRCAEAQAELEGNIYCTPNEDELVNRWDGRDFKNFEEYKNAGFEKNAKHEKIDISEYLK